MRYFQSTARRSWPRAGDRGSGHALGEAHRAPDHHLRANRGEQRSHDLGELWDRLDGETRVEIEALERSLRDGPFGPLHPDFPIEQVLRGDTDSFVTFRYRYETPGIGGVRADDLLRIAYALVRFLGAEPWPSGALDE